MWRLSAAVGLAAVLSVGGCEGGKRYRYVVASGDLTSARQDYASARAELREIAPSIRCDPGGGGWGSQPGFSEHESGGAEKFTISHCSSGGSHCWYVVSAEIALDANAVNVVEELCYCYWNRASRTLGEQELRQLDEAIRRRFAAKFGQRFSSVPTP